MKRNILMIMVVAFFIISLTGCAKCISTETSTVQVKVTDEYHRAMYTTPIFTGKTTIITTHPAVYRITVEYNGVEYDISGSDTYDKYSNRVGEYVNGTLETKKYDDGTVRYNIISLE